VRRPATIRIRAQLYEEAVQIIEDHYAGDLELEEIARRIATSPRQLQRAFAEQGDTTFRERLTAVRMKRAAELLANPALTIREVANRVGYCQAAQFAKAFRRHHGIVPSAYRVQRLQM